MSPFKEPQPRKTPEGGIPIVPKGVFPPYARVGNEARWEEPSTPAPDEDGPIDETGWGVPTHVAITRHEFETKLAKAREEGHAAFELRKAALEAACALQTSSAREAFWKNLATCEDYLRDGARPS